MRLPAAACLGVLAFIVLQPAHAAGVRHVTVLNGSPHAITQIASRAPGDDVFTASAGTVDARSQQRIALPSGRCRQDVKFTLQDGREIVQPGIDLCRHGGLRVQALAAGDARLAARDTTVQCDDIAAEARAPTAIAAVTRD